MTRAHKIIEKANKWNQNGRLLDAEKLCRKGLKKDPQHAGILFNLAESLHKQGRASDAIKAYSDVLTCKGTWELEKAAAANNIGLICISLYRLEDAKTAFILALQIKPDYRAPINNLGNYYLWKGEYDDASECFGEAATFDDDPSAKMNLGMVNLLLGDMPVGWKQYEHRWQASNVQTIAITNGKPQWDDEDLKGKTILLTSEQGLGDAIMGIRYVRLVQLLSPAKILHHGHAETVELFKGVAGLEGDVRSCERDPNDIDPSSYDYHCPLFSLPRIFKTTVDTVPNKVPYIDTSIFPGSYILSGGNKPKIGLVWAGAPKHAKDIERSVSLEEFKPLLECNATFFSLQKGDAAKQLKDLPSIVDIGGMINDLVHCAKALQELDLLISVDTMPVHLAGALNIPVWMLTPRHPDWRWMLKRLDSPWYPSLRLFRQEEVGDWSQVINDIKPELERFCEHRGLHKVTAS